MLKSFLVLFVLALLLPSLCQAQIGVVSDKFRTVATEVKSVLRIVIPVLMLIGLAQVFFMYKNGNPDAKNRLIQVIIGGVIYAAADAIMTLLNMA
ncbi:TrbC/VirB2 family protein [Paraflavisolibacter sp. H34]|uniref:TrbC/VirB2 family protein n=1 Tax=Huijunlia imazamoxiresistens TaxID=3127457 RepID=UPI003019A4D9